MEVEYVQLVVCHQINIALDICNTEEMPGYIQHGASPGKPGIVSNRPSGHRPWARLQSGIFNCCRQYLPNRLDAPKQACWFVSHESHQIGCYSKLISSSP